jgi:Trk-type K+ transport system membrane component
VNRVGRFQRLLEHRWVLVLLAVAIGLVSLFLFSITVQRDYWEYLIYPKEKAADNYIYPQLRYTVFDVALLLWCLDGFVACGLSLRSALSKRSLSGWTYRTIAIYFVLFTALILGGILMMAARSHGL